MAVSSYSGAQVHGGNALDADAAAAANYYFDYEHKKRIDITNARISFVVQPQHGQIIQKPNDTLYYYKPNEGYQGKDRVEALVEGDGYKVRVVYDILSGLSDVDIGNEESWRLCPKGLSWKISQSDFNPSTQDYAAWLRSSELSTLIASASQTLTDFQDLAGSSVGQTTGEGANAQITLDSNAAGHGWYIDPTPLDPSIGSGLAEGKRGKGSGLVLRQHYPLPQPAHALYCLQTICYALSSNKPIKYAKKRSIWHKNEGFGQHDATTHWTVRVVKMGAQNG